MTSKLIWRRPSSGGSISRQHTEVTSIVESASSPLTYPWVVHTPRGTINARTVIIATNGYTSA
ncbi:hypothetical protein P175DRAFT_0501901 [Aspergillus ochraceoroseus IBT 24754]|uniref:FAD dependent oxidoreductase domain-containing protein n=1 Tax=Aspergillus ochraceoroseus IBT 24754 TaxID=1392256 RepID=A0A2T5LYA2_9EURO|nr:uncharacterized protein P175DRAFT_0501901 [Aspergillus ochraceoroseus IBT 24754]PTU21270.1 hypothetical protein P175DRAFT_0501901 [Aspergillus ochraceoroseus IBT 24754]